MIRIDWLHQKLREIRKEIKLYQGKCKHKKQEIRFLETKEHRWICRECEAIIGWPTPDELDKWIGK